MNAFITVAALVAAAGVQAGPASQAVSSSLVQAAFRAKWSAFKAQHQKDYPSHVESAKMAKFLENTQAIEEHNARFHQGLESFEMGHNEMSDMSLDEIMSTRMGVQMPPNAMEMMNNVSTHVMSSGYQHPAKLDWRTWNGVTAVKNQGSCGSCYTFSAIGAVETAHWRKHNYLPTLSEQHLLDCTGEYGNGGCGGGWMHTAFKWILDNNRGYVKGTDYPYTGRVDPCQHNNKAKQGYLNRYVRVPVGNEQAILDAVATTGTVSIAYNAGTTEHSYYRGGILHVNNCGNRPTHAVLVVGYGTENGRDYWIIKNSWGATWGENGYFRMTRGQNMCGIADWASYPVV